MASMAPSTPENTRHKSIMNRSFTVPSKMPISDRSNSLEEAVESVETLYRHPDVKVLNLPSNLAFASPKNQQDAGSLPWASPTESTVASGSLEIYRVPGTKDKVSFISARKWLVPFMTSSQCWCVDGHSKFVVKISMIYYRLELPGKTPEDLERVEKLKDTFKKLLKYEKTPCPFSRSFTVELLPEEPAIKKRRRKSHGPAKKWKLENASRWRPEDGEEPPMGNEGSSEDDIASDDEASSTAQENSSPEDPELVDEAKDLDVDTPSRPTVRDRVKDWSAKRSITEPIHTPSQFAQPPDPRASPEDDDTVNQSNEVESQADSEATLRTFQAIPVDMPPSPPDSSAGFEFTEPSQRHEVTTVPDSVIETEEPSFDDSDVAKSENAGIVGSADAMRSSDQSDGESEKVESKPKIPPGTLRNDAVFDTTEVNEVEPDVHNRKPGRTSLVEEHIPERSTSPQPDDTGIAGPHLRSESEEDDLEQKNDPIFEDVQTAAAVGPSENEGDNFERKNYALAEDVRFAVAESSSEIEKHIPEQRTSPLEDVSLAAAGGSAHSEEHDSEQRNAPQLEGIPTPGTVDLSEREEQALKHTDNIEPEDLENEAPAHHSDEEEAPENEQDPFAQIQARIQARRSIGGTLSFAPASTKSSSSSSTSISSASQSGFSRQPSHHQQAFAGELVRKACDVFLGPPIRLVLIMLRIAARITRGGLTDFLSESVDDGQHPHGLGTFEIDSDVEDFDLEGEWETDDFGVPLRSPVRLAAALKNDTSATGTDANVKKAKARRRRSID